MFPLPYWYWWGVLKCCRPNECVLLCVTSCYFSLTRHKKLWKWINQQWVHHQVAQYLSGGRVNPHMMSPHLQVTQWTWLLTDGVTSGTWCCCAFWCSHTTCKPVIDQCQTSCTQSCTFQISPFNSAYFLKPSHYQYHWYWLSCHWTNWEPYEKNCLPPKSLHIALYILQESSKIIVQYGHPSTVHVYPDKYSWIWV